MKNQPVWALGTMSGTSLDGVDAAMVLTDGTDVLEIGASAYRAYTDRERAVLEAALGAWEGPAVSAAARVVEVAHIEVLSGFTGAEVIGFHGQTLSHDPAEGRTLQVGDGARLSEALNVPVVWDFRSADVALGGQGAPLAPFYHFALARWMQAPGPIAVLNIGGVANLTWIDPARSAPETDGALLAFDTGPGNAPLNDLVSRRRNAHFDRDGLLAGSGEIIDDALYRLLANPYFAKEPPKSLDRNDFSIWLDAVSGLGDADAAATLAAGIAASIALSLPLCPVAPTEILVTGGGRSNPVLMDFIGGLVDCPVRPVEDVGLDGDMLEAQAFAHLAVRVQRGLPTSALGTTGVPAPVGGGQVSGG